VKTHNFVQGSPEWHAHRATHYNASDAPAMMGCDPHRTRTQFMHEMHTGITRKFSNYVQDNILDAGHRFEALARPLAAIIIGETLYPVTGSKGKYSASFDGLTMGEDVVFEHKTLNENLRSILVNGCIGSDLPLFYRVQLEHQLIVSMAEKSLFMASKWDSDKLVEERHCWYMPDLKLRAQIVAGWEQFEKDRSTYVPTEPVPVAIAAPVETLPAVSVRMDGALAVVSNLPAFGEALKAFIAKLPAKPSTDQEFADTEAACKALKKAEDALETAETNALASIADVEAMRRMVADFRTLARATRLAHEKLVAGRKEAIRGEIVAEGIAAFREHIAGLNSRLGNPYMPNIPADFGGAIKGKRTVDSIRDAVATELARAKIEANAIADKIDLNLQYLREYGKDHTFLFADTETIILKAVDDFQALVKSRIVEHQTAEAKRLESEHERILAKEKFRADLGIQAMIETEQKHQFDEQCADIKRTASQNRLSITPSVEPNTVPKFPKTADDYYSCSTINEILSPLYLSEIELCTFGFEPIGHKKTQSVYEAIYPKKQLLDYCDALIRHVESVRAQLINI